MRGFIRLWIVALGVLLVMPWAAGAQAGGSIIGTVVDGTDAVLPGVTITVTGPALIAARTAVTGADGTYRVPNLPAGSDYSVVFELEGFGTLRRDGIRLDVGFTAAINTTLNPATVEQNLVVTGETPVVDVTNASIATQLNADQLEVALVGSRDYAAVMALMPGVIHNNTDVGGSSATTMQAYRAYGLNNGRGQIEGINGSQYNSGGLLGYSDMDAFEGMAVNLSGNSAETPVPGAFVNVVTKSGGNEYHGGFYVDYQPRAFSATNIDQALINRGLTVGLGGRPDIDVHDLNKFELWRDLSGNTGGFLIKDRLWWFGSLRYSTLSRRVPSIIDGVATTYMPSFTGKITWSITPNHKVAAFQSYTKKLIDNYLIGGAGRIHTVDTLVDEKYPNSTEGVTYDAILGAQMVLTLRAGHFGDGGPYPGKGRTQRYDDVGTSRIYGTYPTFIDARDRPQANGSLNMFAGDHSLKIGGEFQHEQLESGRPAFGPNNTILYLNNNVPTQVDVYLVPSATRAVGRSKSAYVSDEWRVNQRLTLNLGYRFDQYTNYVPEQTGPQGHEFPKIVAPTFNLHAPRLGIVYALTDDQKTLIKGSYGLYWDSPGHGLASAGNPNPPANFTRYEWINPNPTYNANGLPIFEGAHQLGRVLLVQGARADFSPAVTYDPDLKQQYTPSASVFFEREVAANFGVRTGLVWNGIRNPRTTVNVNQPFDAFNVPVAVPNPGPDGRVGTADDGGVITAFNLDPARLSLPVVQVLKNGAFTNSDYYTWEVTANRRLSNRWSLLATFSNLWARDGIAALTPNALINTTDGRNASTQWQARIEAYLQMPYGINLTPIMRGQQGTAYAPTFSTRLNYSSAVPINAALHNEQRNDNVVIWDVRAAKEISMGRGLSVQGFADVYNIFNTNAVQSMTTGYGAAYLRPSVISGPRIARIGMRFTF